MNERHIIDLVATKGLADFEKARVLVVGDVMLDTYWHGPTSRISPEAPVPVVKIDQQEARVGGAGNVALNIAVLGAQSQLIALAGEDDTAERIESLLTEMGVVCNLQRVAGCQTINKLRVLSRHQQLIRLDFDDYFLNANPAALLAAFTAALANVDAIVFSDYGKGALRDVAVLIAAARSAGKPVIIDPKGTDFKRYRGATMLTPNLAEFEAIVGHCASEEEIVRRGEALRDSLELDAILITRSERGMTLLEREHPPVHLAARAQEVFDVTGAGDTVAATIGTAVAAGMRLADAVALSNIAASIVVAKLGTATASRAELIAAIGVASKGTSNGICTEAELLEKTTEAKRNGLRVVMTNGCFDILHPGHIDYLQRARELGDLLVVAVNDDDSVRRLKGTSRPINPVHDRMRMLDGLACVDWVVPFSEDTPERVYAKILPAVLVKGGDYTVQQVAGSDSVERAGGQTVILDFVHGHSTTNLIAKIRDEKK